MKNSNTPTPKRSRGGTGRAAALVVALVVSGVGLHAGPATAGTPCVTSGPSYTVTVCFIEPTDGASLTGTRTVTASVAVSGIHPGVQRTVFRLGGDNLLTDYAPPYTFSLPTNRFVDGPRVLEVEAIMRDGFTTQRSSVDLTFANGNTQPPVNTNTFTPATGSTPAPGRPFVLAAAGDGADGSVNEQAVTNLIASWSPNMFLYLGDVYEKGTSTEFHNWYGTPDRFYGRFRGITNPAVGNHESSTSGAPGYFDYWDNVPHYYSFNVAGWHLISLDSTSEFNQVATDSPQYQWLAQDLSSSSAPCTLAFFHHPPFTVGPSDPTRLQPMWSLLADRGVDVVLTGHDHDYQRWQALDASGNVKSGGTTEFVVGTGGHGIQPFTRTDSRMVRGFDTSPAGFGALRLELNQHGAAFRFVDTQGASLDSGSIPCSGAPSDNVSPTAPTNLSAVAPGANHVDLTWTSSTDNVGVTGYDIYRNDQLIARAGPAPAYMDLTVVLGTAYQYRIKARDATGRVSGWSNIASVTTPLTTQNLFSDDFETGDLSKWTSSVGLLVQGQEVAVGSFAARGTSTGSPTHAIKQLITEQSEIYYRTRFKFISRGANTVYLLKFRSAANASLLGFYVSSTGKLGYRNDVAGVSSNSTIDVPIGSWHDLKVRARIDGAAGETETWLDGVRIPALSKTESLGTARIGKVQLGDPSTGRTYDVAFDEVAVEPVPSNEPPPVDPITLTVTDGYDEKRDKTLVEDGNRQNSVRTSDNKRLEVEAGYYIAFQFDHTVPAGVTIQSVKVNVEHHEEDKLSPSINWGVVVWPPGQSQPSVYQTITLTPTSSPGLLYGDKKEATAEWDVSAWIDSAEEANDFWFFVQNDSTNGKKTRLDHIYVVVTYSPPSASATITSAPTTEATVAQPYTYEPTASGTQPITWELLSGPPGMTIDPNTGVVSWTPTGAGSFGVQIKARNLAGGDVQSYTLNVPVPSDGTLFSDGFETGDLSFWNTTMGLVVQGQDVSAGSFAARGTSMGTATYAYKQLGTETGEVYYRIRFKIVSQAANTVNLLKFRTAANGSILGVYVSSTGKLGYRNDVAGISSNSTTAVAPGVWHELQVRVRINSSTGETETWLDGVRIAALSKAESFGTSLIGKLQLGDTSSGRTYDAAFDDVKAGTAFIGA